MSTLANINHVCDYIIENLNQAGEQPSVLKVQKLLYYVQAWHLAIHKTCLFNGKFEAWVHGPVNREIYRRFMHKSMYTPLLTEDSRCQTMQLTAENITAINDVLHVYAPYSGSQLEDMTHQETPWLDARKGLHPAARCEQEISEETMQHYYEQRLQ